MIRTLLRLVHSMLVGFASAVFERLLFNRSSEKEECYV